MATCYSGLGHEYMVVIAFYESDMLGKYKLANSILYEYLSNRTEYGVLYCIRKHCILCSTYKNTDII